MGLLEGGDFHLLSFLQDRRGGNETIAFAAVLMLLMLIVLNLLPPIKQLLCAPISPMFTGRRC